MNEHDPKENISDASLQVVIKNKALVNLAEAYLSGTKSSYSTEQANAIKKWAKTQIRGYGLNVAMACSGKKCPLVSSCPFYKEHIEFPEGERCPYEHLNAVERLLNLLVEFNIDVDSPEFKVSEFRSVIEIVQIEMISDRITSLLAEEGLTISQPVASGDGLLLEEQKEHPLLKYLVTLSNRREQILKQFKATRASLTEVDPSRGKLSKPVTQEEIAGSAFEDYGK